MVYLDRLACELGLSIEGCGNIALNAYQELFREASANVQE
jgi:hypothetical protein